jgi:hypothetical protein
VAPEARLYLPVGMDPTDPDAASSVVEGFERPEGYKWIAGPNNPPQFDITKLVSTQDSNCGNACCTGVLEANLNSNVIGVAHIGWLSRDPMAEKNLKGRHAEYGRSVEDLTRLLH